MCYPKPGPRCSSHAALTLQMAKTKRRESNDFDKYFLYKTAEDEAQLEYDSTPAGQAELEDKIRIEKEKGFKSDSNETRLDLARVWRKEKLALLKESQRKGDFEKSSHQETEIGSFSLENFHTDFLPDGEMRDQVNLTQELMSISHEWIQKLDADELKAINWYTSNGFSAIATYHATGKIHPSIKEYSPEQVQHMSDALKSAMDKAPRLEKPVVLYRGLGAWNFDETQKGALGRSYVDVSIDEVKEKYQVGSMLSVDLPLSSTPAPNVAGNFADADVVLEIKTRTMASPVNISSWGTSEQETFIAPSKNYKITGISEQKYNIGRRRNEENIIVVQVEGVE